MATTLRTVWDEQLIGRPDSDVLERATGQCRVVVTHDVAFGRSAIRAGGSFVGIIYPRPGHISAGFALEYGVTRLALSGSHARGDATETRDVDVLVEVDPSSGIETPL